MKIIWKLPKWAVKKSVDSDGYAVYKFRKWYYPIISKIKIWWWIKWKLKKQ